MGCIHDGREHEKDLFTCLASRDLYASHALVACTLCVHIREKERKEKIKKEVKVTHQLTGDSWCGKKKRPLQLVD